MAPGVTIVLVYPVAPAVRFVQCDISPDVAFGANILAKARGFHGTCFSFVDIAFQLVFGSRRSALKHQRFCLPFTISNSECDFQIQGAFGLKSSGATALCHHSRHPSLSRAELALRCAHQSTGQVFRLDALLHVCLCISGLLSVLRGHQLIELPFEVCLICSASVEVMHPDDLVMLMSRTKNCLQRASFDLYR
jgi:hypothetical protein